MNRSEKVLREVLTNQEEIDEFLKQETLEEIYEFVLKRDNSITKKEFDSCIAEIIEKYLAIEKANAVEKGRIKEKDMDMIAGGKGMLSKSMASVLSTLMLTTGANIPVNATNGEETNKTGIKSSIMEKVNYVIEKIGDAKRFVVKKGEEGFEKTSKILKEHPWIKPVLCVVIVLAVGSGTVFAINKHKEKNKNKVIDPVASPDLTADDEGEEGEKKEEEKKEEKKEEEKKEEEKKEEEKKEEEKKEEEKKQRDAITRVLRKISNNPEEVKQFGENTWKERYEFISRKNSSITKEGFCSYYNVDPSLLTEESERFEQAAAPEAAVSGEGGNQEELEQAAAPEAAVSGEGDDQEGSEHVDSAEAAVSGEEGSQEGSEDAVLPPSEAAGGVEGDNQEGSEHVDSAEAAIADETGENVNSQGSGKREDKKIPIVNIPKASSSPVAVTVEYNNEKQLLKEMIKDTVETTQWLDKNGGFSDEESRDKYNGCVYILNDDGKTFEERKKAYDELQEMAKSFRPKSLLEGAFGWLRWK